jgi:hypothetical protein
LSIIIVCRFYLTLKERHSRLNNPSLPTLSFTSFLAARQSVHNAVVVEFGDPCLSQIFSTETFEDAYQESGQSLEEARSAGIELGEFPWAIGYPRDVEMAEPIDSSEQSV